MITVCCAGCDEPSVSVEVSLLLPADKIIEAVGQAGFERCDHCEAYYHRIGCFTFHKTPADRPVPFVSRKAERMERDRLAWLARRDAA